MQFTIIPNDVSFAFTLGGARITIPASELPLNSSDSAVLSYAQQKLFPIVPIETKTGVIGWRVWFHSSVLTILVSDLAFPGAPTNWQILHVAQQKLNPSTAAPKFLKRAEKKQSRIPRYRSNESWSNAHEKCQQIAIRDGLNIDQLAQAMASEFPELCWDPSDDNGGKLWAILLASSLRRPSKTGLDTIERAAELLADRNLYKEIEFAEWCEDESGEFESADSEYVPY
jgi:hypothetical protein